MKTAPNQIVKNGNMAAQIISAPVDCRTKLAYSVQANSKTTGTLGGTWSLQGSLDYQIDLNGNVLNAGNWQTIANSSQAISLSNTSGVTTWDFTQTGVPWVRAVYAPAGGDTGTANVFGYTKGNI